MCYRIDMKHRGAPQAKHVTVIHAPSLDHAMAAAHLQLSRMPAPPVFSTFELRGDGDGLNAPALATFCASNLWPATYGN